MRRYITILLLFMIHWASLQAQFVFAPGQGIDFGYVENWHNPPAVFNLVNTGTKPLAILKLTGSKNIVAEYPRNYIQPGDTGKIVIRYYTPVEGSFSENIEVSLTASVDPIRLTVKGKIRSIASDALTACPNDQMQGTAPNFNQQFIALDENTGKPIPGAHFFVGTQGQMLDEFKIPNNSRNVTKTYKSGMYVLQISAENYSTVDTGIVILAGQRTFTFYLKQNREEPVVAVATIPNPEPTPAIIQTPPPPPVVPTTTKRDTIISADETNPTLPIDKYKPNNIVFVLDVSASMRILGRIDMLKESMLRLTEVLRKSDKVSIITFTTSPITRIQGASGSQKDTLTKIIHSFTAGGATNGIKGLRHAYEMAERNFIADGNNMVIIGTDGVFAQTDENGVNIQTIVQEYLDKNIKLGVMAFGRDEEAIKSMEKVAAKGKGGFMRMKDPASAPQLLLEQIQKQSAR